MGQLFRRPLAVYSIHASSSPRSTWSRSSDRASGRPAIRHSCRAIATYEPGPRTHSVSKCHARSQNQRSHGSSSTAQPSANSTRSNGLLSYSSRGDEYSNSSTVRPAASGSPSSANLSS